MADGAELNSGEGPAWQPPILEERTYTPGEPLEPLPPEAYPPGAVELERTASGPCDCEEAEE